MDGIKGVDVIEADIDDVNDKCSKIQCNSVYQTIKAIIKLTVDLFKCIKPKISQINFIMFFSGCLGCITEIVYISAL